MPTHSIFVGLDIYDCVVGANPAEHPGITGYQDLNQEGEIRVGNVGVFRFRFSPRRRV